MFEFFIERNVKELIFLKNNVRMFADTFVNKKMAGHNQTKNKC